MDLYRGKYRRDSKRLQGHDYSSPGYYFITINVRDRSPIFGHASNGKHWLSPTGMIADHCWQSIPDHFPHTRIDEYVIMPDHVHGIIRIVDSGLTDGDKDLVAPKNFSPPCITPFKSPSRSIPSIVRGFKIGVTKWARQNGHLEFEWQPNYYDRIIRNQIGLEKVRQYIRDNPWKV